MNSLAGKTQERKSKTVANGLIGKQSGNKSLIQFVDNRPEAKEQSKLQMMVENSCQFEQLKHLQRKAQNCHQPQQKAKLSAIANHGAPIISQRKQSPEEQRLHLESQNHPNRDLAKQASILKTGGASPKVTQLLKDNRKTMDIDALNYAQLKLYAEQPAGVEFDRDEDLRRINERIAEFEGVEGANKVDCSEGKVKTATAGQIIYFNGITSCLAITVILDDSSKIAAHKALKSPIDNATSQIKDLIAEERTIASVTVGGSLSFWTRDLRKVSDLGENESLIEWGLGESDNSEKLKTYLGAELGTDAGKIDVQDWDDGKYAISALGESIKGVREPKAANGWIQDYCNETYDYNPTAAAVVDWLIEKNILEAGERKGAIKEVKEFASSSRMYQSVIKDWFTIKIPEFAKEVKNHGDRLLKDLFAINAFTIEGAIEYEEIQKRIIDEAILLFKAAVSYDTLRDELEKAKKRLDDIEVE